MSSQPVLPRRVVQTLAFFTAAMIVLPLLSFFALRHFKFNSLLCGGVAAGVANIVLIAYVAVAIFEKEDPAVTALKEKKKLQ